MRQSFIRAAVMMLLTLMTATMAWAENNDNGKCGPNLYFQYDSGIKKLTIWKESADTSGSMYDYDINTVPKWDSYKGEIKEIVIEDGVTDIGNYAFSRCYSLTKITIAGSVTKIGQGAFQECDKLTSIPLPANLNTIGNSAFMQCVGLTSITIPNSVTSIDEWAFSGCTGLTSVTIPASVTSISNNTFTDCSSLTSIDIPNSVTSIGERAFSGCSSLTSIDIPNSVMSISEYAFAYCSSLTSIDIPNSVTSIGQGAFFYCTGLTSVTIPNSVTSIGQYAFRGCTGLTSVTIGNGVTSIGQYAFWGCTGLISVTIGSGVTSIGEGTFYWCNDLTKVYCYAPTPPTLTVDKGGISPFWKNASGRKFYVPVEKVETYQQSWSQYNSDIVGINTYHITLEALPADGSFGTATVSTAIAAQGDKVTLTATPQAGYHFVWWNVTGGAVISKPSAEVTTLIMPKTDVTVTAIFRGNDDNPTIHTLTLENNNPDDSAAMAESMSGYSSYTLPTRSRSGYVLLGWSRLLNGDPDYKVGETITLEADLTLYAIWMKTPIELADKASNTLTLDWLKKLGACEVKIKDRELFKDGYWNTLCLPFDVTITGSVLDNTGLALMEFDKENSGFDAETGTLALKFTAATSIKAGVPYLIKWGEPSADPNAEVFSILSPTFQDAAITGTPAAVVKSKDGKVGFHATYNAIWFEGGDRSILYLGANNKLYYPSQDVKFGAFRAYFQLDGITAADVSTTRMVFEVNEASGITTTNHTNFANNDGVWYDLSGRKLNGKPTTKGLYIVNGKKVVVK